MKLLTKIRLLSIFIFILAPMTAFAAERQDNDYSPYPNPDRGYVTDTQNVLTYEQQEEMESWLYTAEVETNVEIVVVIIDSIKDYKGTKNSSIETFARGLFDKYRIGNMPDNNGVLLVVAIKDRKTHIELGAGYGRGRDRDSVSIIQNVIVPQFRKGNYSSGIMIGTKAILSEFASMPNNSNSTMEVTRSFPSDSTSKGSIAGWIKLVIAFAIIALIPITISLFKTGKRGWGWICVGLIIVLVLAILNLIARILESLPDNDSDSSNSIFGGVLSGGGSSGGGGFGGGFSGGGGATGSW